MSKLKLVLVLLFCAGCSSREFVAATAEHCSIYPDDNIEVFTVFIEAGRDEGITKLEMLSLLPQVCFDDPFPDQCVLCGTELIDGIY